MTAGSAMSSRMPTVGTYRVDPVRSKVSYSGRHMFGLGVVHATFTIRDGELRVAEPPVDSTVVVTIDAASLTSNSAKRDKDVRAAGLLDVETHADITFTSDGVRRDGDLWVFTGTVRAHGTAVPVEIKMDRMTLQGGRIHAHARAEHLDRYAFGVTKSKGMVGRYLDLDIDVLAVPV